MKRRIIIMYMALMLLTGCSGRSAGWQTGNVTLVRAVGVDRGQAGVMLTAWGGAAERLTAEGSSVAEGVQKLQAMGDSFVHFGHADQLLLGEEFARDGTAQLVDFVARDRQIGPGARLWVLRGGQKTGETNVAVRLERLAGDRESGAKLDCSVTGLMSAMAREGSVAVPALRWEEDQLQPAGYAVLRQGRLVGFLDGEQSLGLELLRGQSEGQTADITLPDTQPLILSVRRADIQCIPRLDAGRLVGAAVTCEAEFEVIQGARLSVGQRQEAERQAEEALSRRLVAALAFAQFWDADFAGVEQMLRMACSPREWSGVDWERDFRTLSLQAAVSAEINWPADMAEDGR
ncbi:MAG: hypothetical protein IJA11_04040 [Oscillospiraceae bacterium]|nr:hypothetical protein [Oscillospiraceae bacterium]